MGLLARFFRQRKTDRKYTLEDEDVDWCTYDPDVICDLQYDCRDYCYYHEWQRRGGRDDDTNFDDFDLDESEFDYNHYDGKDEHKH